MRGWLTLQLAPKDGRGSEPAANSLFWNILRATRLDAIFCEHNTISQASNLPGFNILRTSIKKRTHRNPRKRHRTPVLMRGCLGFQPASTPDLRSSQPAANSLFCNILRATHLDPIFCEHKCISPANNLPEFNILRARSKNHGAHSFSISHAKSSSRLGPKLDTVPLLFSVRAGD
jgi:hypothetical protein